ncbi:hypothetical protein [Actinomadura opuntiae]|uniref:hypothetical protein n=1 Tax=Actinomadura sp. OS1-43 TaxID=604315 RepID=UPI00255B1A65|nr:hypothetical protein [Actinomadura sp. OS1-43]
MEGDNAESVRVDQKNVTSTVDRVVEHSVMKPHLYAVHLDGDPGRPLSQRYLAEKHDIDRRGVKQIITDTAQTHRHETTGLREQPHYDAPGVLASTSESFKTHA